MAADSQEKLKEALLKIAGRYSDRLERFFENQPELLGSLLDAIISSQREEILSVLSKAEGTIKELLDRLPELDKDEVIAVAARLVATEVITSVRTNRKAWEELMSVIAKEFVDSLDLEAFAQEVAEQVAERMAKQVRVQFPPPQGW